MDWQKVGLLGDALTGFGAGYGQGGWGQGFQGANQSLNTALELQKQRQKEEEAKQEKLRKEHALNVWLSQQPASMQQAVRAFGPDKFADHYFKSQFADRKPRQLQDGYDAQGRKVKGYMENGEFVQVGGAEALKDTTTGKLKEYSDAKKRGQIPPDRS